VRIVRFLAATCAVIALVAACLTADPQGPRLFGEDDDAQVSVDLSDTLPAVPIESPLVPPNPSGSVHVDHRPPPSRLTTAEVFRPPRVCG
jgi:hypothetical protein